MTLTPTLDWRLAGKNAGVLSSQPLIWTLLKESKLWLMSCQCKSEHSLVRLWACTDVTAHPRKKNVFSPLRFKMESTINRISSVSFVIGSKRLGSPMMVGCRLPNIVGFFRNLAKLQQLTTWRRLSSAVAPPNNPSFLTEISVVRLGFVNILLMCLVIFWGYSIPWDEDENHHTKKKHIIWEQICLEHFFQASNFLQIQENQSA